MNLLPFAFPSHEGDYSFPYHHLHCCNTERHISNNREKGSKTRNSWWKTTCSRSSFLVLHLDLCTTQLGFICRSLSHSSHTYIRHCWKMWPLSIKSFALVSFQQRVIDALVLSHHCPKCQGKKALNISNSLRKSVLKKIEWGGKRCEEWRVRCRASLFIRDEVCKEVPLIAVCQPR